MKVKVNGMEVECTPEEFKQAFGDKLHPDAIPYRPIDPGFWRKAWEYQSGPWDPTRWFDTITTEETAESCLAAKFAAENPGKPMFLSCPCSRCSLSYTCGLACPHPRDTRHFDVLKAEDYPTMT